MVQEKKVEKRTRDEMVEKFLYWNICAVFLSLPISTALLEISSILALSVWVFSGKFIKDRHKWYGEKWVKPVIIFMILPVFALFWTEDIPQGVDIGSKSYYWFFSFVIVSVSFKRYAYKRLLDAFLLGLLFTAFIAILQTFGIVPMKGGRATGFTGPITLSLFYVFGIIGASFYFSRAHVLKEKIITIVLVLIYFFGLSVSGGRSGYLVCFILTPLFFYNIFRKRFAMGVLVTSLLVLMIGSVPLVQQRAIEVLNNLEGFYSQNNKNTSVGLRLLMWRGAFHIFLDNPFLGVGTGGFEKAVKEYDEESLLHNFIHPHNTYLYIASSYGVVGIVSLAWLFIEFFRKGWHVRGTVAGYSTMCFALILFLGSMTDSSILSVATGKMFALLMGAKIE